MDLYGLLKISQSATAEEIRTAYIRAAQETHPDKNPKNRVAATIKFRQIQNAYETLKDPDKKRVYDRRLEQSRRIGLHTSYPNLRVPGAAHPPTAAKHGHPMDMFKDVFSRSRASEAGAGCGERDEHSDAQTSASSTTSAASPATSESSPTLSSIASAPSCYLHGAYLDPYYAVFSGRNRNGNFTMGTPQTQSQATSRESHSPTLDQMHIDARKPDDGERGREAVQTAQPRGAMGPPPPRRRARSRPPSATTAAPQHHSQSAVAAGAGAGAGPAAAASATASADRSFADDDRTRLRRTTSVRGFQRAASYNFDTQRDPCPASTCAWGSSSWLPADCPARATSKSKAACRGRGKLSSASRLDLCEAKPTICEPPKVTPGTKIGGSAEAKRALCSGCKGLKKKGRMYGAHNPKKTIRTCAGHECPVGQILKWMISGLERVRNSFESQSAYAPLEDEAQAAREARGGRRSASEEPKATRRACMGCGLMECLCKSEHEAEAARPCAEPSGDLMEEVPAHDSTMPSGSLLRSALDGQPLCRVPCITGHEAATRSVSDETHHAHRRSGSPKLLRTLDSWNFLSATPKSDDRFGDGQDPFK
mmetsp:Transcript_6885/g.26590  ORF Transcript_6885/g.26590 Transcript_6885/m.26590 type:complete len:594 (-) Transcript_6885:73-1854(-)